MRDQNASDHSVMHFRIDPDEIWYALKTLAFTETLIGGESLFCC